MQSRQKDYNVNAAITDFDGETFYYENGLINQQNSLIGNKDNKKVKVESYRLETILNNFSIPNIDYLNIDVEGIDYKVIASLDFSKYRPKLISIEQNVYNSEKIIISETHKLLTKKNYFLASKIGVTCIYIDNKYEDKIEKIMSI